MNSAILRAATRLIVSLMLLFSLFVLFRGHDEPGGGFIGGLVAVIAFALLAIAFGPACVRESLRVDPRTIAGAGISSALIAGLIPLLAGRPFLTALWWKVELAPGAVLPLSTVLLFDIGVYLVVIGAVLCLVLALEEEPVS